MLQSLNLVYYGLNNQVYNTVILLFEFYEYYISYLCDYKKYLMKQIKLIILQEVGATYRIYVIVIDNMTGCSFVNYNKTNITVLPDITNIWLIIQIVWGDMKIIDHSYVWYTDKLYLDIDIVISNNF